MNIQHKGIRSIQEVIRNKETKYEIVLNPNYSFESTGSQIQYVDKEYIEEMINEIVYCDGESLER